MTPDNATPPTPPPGEPADNVSQDELDALHRRLKDAEAALDTILLLPDPEEDEIVRVLDVAQAAIDMIERNTGRLGGGR